MADRTLLVPGTQASTLVDQHGSTVYDAVRCSFRTMVGAESKALEGGYPPEVWHDLLGMEHQRDVWMPIRSSLLDGVTLSPGEVVRTPYDRLWGLVDVPWAYDWRGDIRYNALRLLRWLEDNRPADGRWNLIGHSQGALVIVAASKLTQRVDDFARLVARVVLVGGPLAGTMRALEALLWGSTGLGKSDERVESALAMGRSWPALYQMLPAWASVLGKDGKERPLAEQFTEEGGWPVDSCGEGIQPQLLVAARETQQLLAGPFSRFGTGIAVRAVHGRSQNTPITLKRDGDELPKKRDDMKEDKGDTLVPDDLTRAWGGLPFQANCVSRTRLKRHAFLLEDEWVVEAIGAFLEEEAPAPPPLP